MATSQSGGVTSLPYINTVTPVSTDGVPLYTSTEPVSLLGTGGSVSEIRGPSDPRVNVMPHPPLRSGPTSAGATRTRLSSAGRERIPGPPVAKEDSAFSNASIIHQLREQVSQLQAIVQEKEENEKAAAQKLAMYQNQLHAKNNEVLSMMPIRGGPAKKRHLFKASSICTGAGGEDSAFSNASIIHQLREQVSQLQAIVQEKEENEKAAAQKLAMYQNQLHAKNNEVATLKD
ncbi:unnamed protein product [Porites evermanni]|uniref:Uncharacterized protein n=1 Tax=Porites evermanni TaxID=104178 RepID=A0ABN8SYY6_9CNID|nr:unnamed protein product [Porites evermanni]